MRLTQNHKRAYTVGMRLLKTKTEAIKLFGTTKELAAALNISTSAISQWPEYLDQRKRDEVFGAAVRINKLRPVISWSSDAFIYPETGAG